MKNILVLLSIIVGLCTQSAFAADTVLVEKVTNVGFAPPKYRGVFKVQLMSSGKVLSIDNQNKVTTLAKLTPAVTAQVAQAVEKVKSEKLTVPTEPPCMDAPSQELSVRQSDGKVLQIWARSGCRDSLSEDPMGMRIQQVVGELLGALDSVDTLAL